LYYYSARFYDPGRGQFISVDPHGDAYTSLNPYHYVSNNPVNYIDPTGMDAENPNDIPTVWMDPIVVYGDRWTDADEIRYQIASLGLDEAYDEYGRPIMKPISAIATGAGIAYRGRETWLNNHYTGNDETKWRDLTGKLRGRNYPGNRPRGHGLQREVLAQFRNAQAKLLKFKPFVKNAGVVGTVISGAFIVEDAAQGNWLGVAKGGVDIAMGVIMFTSPAGFVVAVAYFGTDFYLQIGSQLPSFSNQMHGKL
jgi:hypothetical protein